MQGGVAQGIGWALNEEYVYDQDGRLENPGFLDYRVPVCFDLPMIDGMVHRGAEPAASVWRTRRWRGSDRAADGGSRRDGAAAAGSADVAAETKLRAALDEQDPPRIAAE